MGVSRRSFLKLGIGTGSGVAFAAAARMLPGGVAALDRIAAPRLSEQWPETWVRSACSACGAVCPLLLRRVEGKIVGVRPLDARPCARAYAIPQELYHPDRLLGALRRTGGRGDGAWERLDMPAALERLAEQLQKEGARVAFLLREEAGLSFALLKALGWALGGLVTHHEWAPGQMASDALAAATGWRTWDADLARAQGLVSFGWDWLQSYPDPAQAQRSFGMFKNANAPLIAVGPRLNRTAMRSAEWLACRPAFEPLVALAAAHVVVRNRTYDPACERLENFPDFAASLDRVDLAAVEQQTGVAPRRIEELAAVLASRRLLSVGPRRRLEDQWPVTALNALLGLIGVPGGFLPVPQVLLPAGEPGGELRAEELPERIAREEIDALIVVGVNPAFAGPDPARWRKALHRVPYLICISSFLDETAALADLVLPLALPPERDETYVEWDENENTLSRRRFQPAVLAPPPLISPEKLAFQLASLTEESLSGAFPWKDWEEAAHSLVVRRPETRVFRFPQGFTWEAPEFGAGEYHLLWETPGSLPRMEGAHLPYLLTTVGSHLREWWTTWAEVNPETAQKLGLADRDRVRVESETGSIQARVKLFAGIPRDALCLPLGLGHGGGSFAQKEGGNPAELASFRKDRSTGVVLWDFEKVRLRKE